MRYRSMLGRTFYLISIFFLDRTARIPLSSQATIALKGKRIMGLPAKYFNDN